MTLIGNKIDIAGLSTGQLIAWLEKRKIEPYRARQILDWIYNRQADSFDVMTDLKIGMRQMLSSHFSIGRLQKIKTEFSQDGSRKYLFKLDDDNCIESVLIPEKGHYTLCISSQVGCAQGCRFCMSAAGGFIRNLTKNEIVSQVRDVLIDLEAPQRLTNIVLMGIGEPLANYQNVLRAVETITSAEYGLNFSNRRVTISTAGMVPKLCQLGSDTGVNLAVSLNATDNDTRDMLMPINRIYPLETLLESCRKYPLRPRCRITFEYILLKGINDSADDAKCLSHLLKPIRAKINLIPYNEHEGSYFMRPEEAVILRFQEILLRNNFTAMIRRSKGQDISAACGQLRTKTLTSAS